MKKIILFYSILFLINVGGMYAQIGINYIPGPNDVRTSPLVIKKNTDAIPARTNQLRFKTNETIIQYEVAKSDEYGNVSWGTLSPPKKPINGVYPINGFTYTGNGNTTRHSLQTNAYIKLPPGKWAVNLNFKLNVVKVETTTRYVEQTRVVPARTINVEYRSANRLYVNNTNNPKANSTTEIYTTTNSEAISLGLQNIYYDPATDLNRTFSSCSGYGNSRRCYYTITRSITIPETTITETVPVVEEVYVPLLRNDALWAKITLSERLNSAPGTYNDDRTPDTNVDNRDLFLISSPLIGPATYTNFSGELYIHNKTTGTKTYYVKLNLEPKNGFNNTRYKVLNFASGPEFSHNDRFFAIPAE